MAARTTYYFVVLAAYVAVMTIIVLRTQYSTVYMTQEKAVFAEQRTSKISPANNNATKIGKE